ncbi:hypothetical protein E2C01_078545 [Portunus trituberculatus]|uniref:Uncharacterized protein n=1 Tax=Portunus trituberculatus TaxID=210409 RepID=A0A5B7IQG5_PORTR|nr:hypothetical protein [Portunus trituberculatus]
MSEFRKRGESEQLPATRPRGGGKSGLQAGRRLTSETRRCFGVKVTGRLGPRKQDREGTRGRGGGETEWRHKKSRVRHMREKGEDDGD